MLACNLHRDGRASAQFGALAKTFIVPVLRYKSLQLRGNALGTTSPHFTGQDVRR